MKIAFIQQPFDEMNPPVEGGSLTIWTYQVGNRLARNHDISVFSRQFSGQSADQTDQLVNYCRVRVGNDVRIQKMMTTLERLALHPKPKLPFFAQAGYYKNYIRNIAQELRKLQPDIIHLYNFTQFLPVVRQWNPQAKIVLHMQCDWLAQLDRNVIERRLQDADLIVGCSEYIANRARQQFPNLAGRIRAIVNGVDPEKFNRKTATNNQEDQQKILFVGRVSPEKGVHSLIEAFQKIMNEFPLAQLVIAGPPGNASYEYIVLISDDPTVKKLSRWYHGPFKKGDYFTELKQQYETASGGRVSFTGPVPHTELAALYQNSSLLAFPSLWDEPFGIPLVEAMACQLPVVGYHGGGVDQIVIDGETGILVDRDNPSKLAEAMARVLRDQTLRKKMGGAGYQTVLNKYTWDHVAQDLESQYQALFQMGSGGE